MSSLTEPAYFKFCAELAEYLEKMNSRVSTNNAGTMRVFNALYRAGYRSLKEVMDAPPEKLAEIRNVSNGVIAALKGGDYTMYGFYDFYCQKCGKGASREGAFKVEVTMRDRDEETGRMGVAMKKSYKLCTECGKAVFKTIRKEVEGGDAS